MTRAAPRTSPLPDPGTRLPTRPVGTLTDLVARTVTATPERAAVVDHETLSYAALYSTAQELGRDLRTEGIVDEDVIVVLARRSADLAVALCGILEAGARFLILDADYVGVHRTALNTLSPAGLIDLGPGAGGQLSGASWASHVTSRFSPWSGAEVLIRDRRRVAAPEPRTTPSSATPRAYLAFTSGSTGRPKIVSGGHAPVVRFVSWYADRFGFTADTRFAMLSGLAHDPILRDVFTPFSLGGALLVPPERAIATNRALLDWLGRRRVDVIHITPGLGYWLVRGGVRSTASVRYVMLGGESLRYSLVRDLAKLFPRATFVNFYGATETPQAHAYYVVHPSGMPSAGGSGRSVPIGRGIAGTQLLVLAPDGTPCAVGETGEIHVRSASLAEGYYGDEARTARRFVVNPFTGEPADRLFKTGDLGRYDSTGEATLQGRVDREAKVAGVRVDVQDLESLLAEHPSVERAVFSLTTPSHAAPNLRCFVTLRPGRAASPRELTRFLAQRVAPSVLPRSVSVVDAIPLTPNGKVDHGALERVDGGVPTEAVGNAESRLQRRIREAWQEVLEVPVHSTDNFFDLGGQSLMASAAAQSIADRCGVPCRTVDLYINPTVSGLTAALAGLDSTGSPSGGQERERARQEALSRARARASGSAGDGSN